MPSTAVLSLAPISNETISIVANVLLELLIIRATCRILRIRHKALFALLVFAALALSIFERLSITPRDSQVAAFGALSSIILPIIMASDSLRSRFVKTFLITLSALASEVLSVLICNIIGFEVYSASGLASSSLDTFNLTMTYSIGLFSAAVLLELLIHLCSSDVDISLGYPALILIAVSYILFIAVFTRAHGVLNIGITHAMLLFTANFLTLALSLALSSLARRDVEPRRSIADRAARVRQVRHISLETEGIVHRSLIIHRLRHDIANQMAVVLNLAQQDKIDEADRYLEALLNQTRHISDNA